MSLLNHSDINFADGHYVAMVGRWRGGKVMRERTYGPSLMQNAMDRGRSKGLRHFLYGSTPETIALLTEALTERLPGVQIVSAESPPFRPLTKREERDLVARVAQAKPDIFWVGLGTPLQDRFVEQYGDRLNCTVVPVGAAFDFHAGTKATAPRFVQRLGMEWLFRFMNEPIRLWRRYLFGIPVFLAGVATDRRARRQLTPRLPAIPPQRVPMGDDQHTDGKSATAAA
jgi:N-acetylglucosaminyldiphosphoundecaprenol N-acetyl-beta-D-mannosaminyltransferase